LAAPPREPHRAAEKAGAEDMSHALGEPSTINGFVTRERPRPINLRARHVQRPTDFDTAYAFIVWPVIGAGVFAWAFVFVYWLTR
jgi:hypothetical protein